MTHKSKQSEHLFSILKELLDYSAIGVNLKDDGTINLFFDGCCECDIEIKKYIDLRYNNQTETGGDNNAD